MRYLASELIHRSKDLADIQNTDFLTHDEQTRYLNDAWITVYQWLINKGDKQFVKEVMLETAGSFHDWTEFEIPHDLYQIKSIKNKYTGTLVPRASETDSINAGSYDVVNDRIRLYGNSHGPLLLTYWTTPTYISFPDRDIEAELSVNPTDTCKDSGLFGSVEDDTYSFTIKNLVTNESIAAFDLTLGYTPEEVYLGNGHIVIIHDTTLTYYNYKGEALNAYETTGSFSILKDSDGYIYFQDLVDGEYSNPQLMDLEVDYNTTERVLYIDEDKDAYFFKDGILACSNGNQIELNRIPREIVGIEPFDNDVSFAIRYSDNTVSIFVSKYEGIEEIPLDIRVPKIAGMLKYGILGFDGTYYTIKSYIPDTDMNFPNEMYFSLLACDLAIRYAMKMNANTDGLNNMYTQMQYTFMNTLSQGSDYPRVKRFYSK